MSTFLSLVNRVNRRVNEVELSSSNFASANGFYSTAKDAVNDAIWRINQHQFHWPFNHSEQDVTLVAGQVRYPFESDAKHVDFDSFRVQRDSVFGNSTQHLTRVDYEEYLKRAVDSEYNTLDTSIRRLPYWVFQTQDQNFGVYPPPDNAYVLTYEYFKLPTELVAFGDTPTIPSQFDHIITNGAMEYVYDFRGDNEVAARYSQKFEDGINEMRTIYINRQTSMKDTRTNLGKTPLTGKVI